MTTWIIKRVEEITKIYPDGEQHVFEQSTLGEGNTFHDAMADFNHSASLYETPISRGLVDGYSVDCRQLRPN